jgi:hypothetical protein
MLSNNKYPTLFYASYSCQEGLTSNSILQKQQDVSAAIFNFKTTFADLKTQSNNYDNDIMDNSGNFLPTNTLKDAVKNDIQILLIQENTMYIVGVITTASLILTAILISKS